MTYLAAPGQQAYAQFSPDGRLAAYASDEQGQFEVFVATMPPTGALWQISTGGGSMPRRRRDGRELYFRANNGILIAVTIGAGAGTAAIEERAAPRALFTGIPSPGNSSIFTYTPDDTGQRFLVASSRSSEITAKLGEGGMGEVYRATDTRKRCQSPFFSDRLVAGRAVEERFEAGPHLFRESPETPHAAE